jgi:hypothetical protein
VRAFDHLAVFQMAGGNATDARRTKIGVLRLDATKTAQLLVTGLIENERTQEHKNDEHTTRKHNVSGGPNIHPEWCEQKERTPSCRCLSIPQKLHNMVKS